ncbi:hypothetical protein C8J56DRAFT_1057625 [Mycena floridula]|nr:hypothetical protein C8J56DRAFT_1057625 [Mycena floridula]
MALKLTVPSIAVIGQPCSMNWIRAAQDPSAFFLRLRQVSPSNIQVQSLSIESDGNTSGIGFSFNSCPRVPVGNYIVEALDATSSNTVLASSNIFKITDSDSSTSATTILHPSITSITPTNASSGSGATTQAASATTPALSTTTSLLNPASSAISSSQATKVSRVPIIAGSVVGAIVLLALVGLCVRVGLLRRARRFGGIHLPKNRIQVLHISAFKEAINIGGGDMVSLESGLSKDKPTSSDPEQCSSDDFSNTSSHTVLNVSRTLPHLDPVAEQLEIKETVSSGQAAEELDRSESISLSSLNIRQQQLREHSHDITGRILELEGLVPQLHDAHTEIQRLRAELQWFRDQEHSDWALGLSNSPPPSYREMGSTRTP